MKYFKLSMNNLRGNKFKIYKEGSSLDCGKYPFSNRVVDEWNRLPNEVILSGSIDSFKNKIDRYFRDIRGLK